LQIENCNSIAQECTIVLAGIGTLEQ
jgi:hypothetical protein